MNSKSGDVSPLVTKKEILIAEEKDKKGQEELEEEKI